MNYEEAAKEFVLLIPKVRRSNAEKHIDMISKGEVFMLECVEKNGGVIMPGEIAKAVGVSTARVATFLNAAENKGYIKRQNAENDRRKIKVVLTEAGFQRVRNERERMLARMTLFLEKLGEEDTENLMRIMKKMQEILNSDEFKN